MNTWDLDLFWLINRDWTHPVLDWLMPTLSAIEVWLPFLVILLAFIAWRGSRRERLMLLALALALGLSDAAIGNGLKKTFDRVRPRDQMSGVMIRDLAKVKPRMLALFKAPEIKLSKVKKVPETGNSLPSNHTINLFAAATVIGLFFRRWALPMYVLATAVAYSRVYVGAHWPSDIPPSAALGLSIGWLVVLLLQKLSKPSVSEA